MNKFEDSEGEFEYYLTCPVCGKEGIVMYSKRIPVYCSEACKQKAYRMRKKKRNALDVTKLRGQWARFGESAEYQLFLIYQEYGYTVAANCERAMDEAIRYTRDAIKQEIRS